MGRIEEALSSVVGRLSDQNYAQSFALYRLWFEIGRTYHQIPSDEIFNAIWNNRTRGSTIEHGNGNLIHSTAHLTLRFANDAELDRILAPHCSGLQSRLCTRTLRDFFDCNLAGVGYRESGHGERGVNMSTLYEDANLIAHWTNLGYVEEDAIRNHILQSLISHPELYDHQAKALIILFKLAGDTFEAFAGPSVIDRCFELLKDHCSSDPHHSRYDPVKTRLVQVRAPHVVKRGHRAKAKFQDVVELRERNWEGIPPPPIFTTGKPKPTGTNQKDPAATPVVTSLGLPNGDLGPQGLQSPPIESGTTPETDTTPDLTVHVKYPPPRASFQSAPRPNFAHGLGQPVQLAPSTDPGSTSHSELIDPCNLFIKVWAVPFSTSPDAINTHFTSEPRHLYRAERALYPLPSCECSIGVKTSRFLLFSNSTEMSSGRLPCLMWGRDLNSSQDPSDTQ